MNLMLVGNVGIISAIALLMLTFVNSNASTVGDIWRIIIIIAAMVVLWLLSRSKLLERFAVKIIKKALARFTDLNIKDYLELLNFTGNYKITFLKVREGDWMQNKKLKELELTKEGINMIAIRRGDGTFIDTPHVDSRIVKNDNLIVYGREKALKNLEKRKEDIHGQQEHLKAMNEQEKELEKQERNEKNSRN